MQHILQITNSISLRVITIEDVSILKELMHRIYPPVYKHLWEDDGHWYVEETFSKVKLEKELANTNAIYCFIEYQKETIGVLRLVYDVTLIDLENLKATKLHRIYLDPMKHGKGIGKILMDWAAKEAKRNNSQLLWLEAMNTQEQALQFYKNLGYQISSDFRLSFKLMHYHLRGMHRMFKML